MKTLLKIVDSKAYYISMAVMWSFNAIITAYNVAFFDGTEINKLLNWICPVFIAYATLNIIWKINKCETV